MENPFDAGYFRSEDLRAFGFKSVGENVQIAKTCKIVGLENIEIGDHSRIDDFCVIIASGPLQIGHRVHIHAFNVIGARGGVTFDDYAATSHHCAILSASDEPLGRYMVGGAVPAACVKPKIAPVVFGRHSVAFAHCTVLPGVTMNEGAVACAHSLVSRSVPEWSVVAGAPAVHRLARSRRLVALEALAEAVEAVAA